MARQTLINPESDWGPDVKTAWSANVAAANANFEELYAGSGEYLVNPSGLSNFKQSLGKCGRDLVSGTGLGGVDIVSAGDSISEGGKSSSYLYSSWHHRLKLKLQARFNPPGVVGGYGLVRAVPGNTTTGWAGIGNPNEYGQESGVGVPWALFRFKDKDNNFATATGTAIVGMPSAIRPTNTGAGSSVAMFAFDGTAGGAEVRRMYATEVDILTDADQPNNYHPPAWDLITSQSTGTFTRITPGTGAQTGNPNMTSRQYGARVKISGLTTTNRNLIQLSADSGTYARCTGIIGYNGDYDCGIRVHNCGYWGSTAAKSAQEGFLENIDVWGSGTGSTDANGNTRGGAVNATLFLANWITNDFLTETTEGLSAFETYYCTFVERCLACATSPSVLIWIPVRRTDSGSVEWWTRYKDVLLALPQTYPDVCVLDIDGWLGGPEDSPTRGTALGWRWGDGAHYTDTFQEALANLFYSILTSGF